MEQQFKAKVVYVLSIVCYIILLMGVLNFVLSAINLLDDINGAKYFESFVNLIASFSLVLAGLYLLVLICEILWCLAGDKGKVRFRAISTLLTFCLVVAHIAFITISLIKCSGMAFSTGSYIVLEAGVDAAFQSSAVTYLGVSIVLLVCNILRLKKGVIREELETRAKENASTEIIENKIENT